MPSAPATATWRPAPAARVRSWFGDWLVVGAWLGVLSLVALLLRPLLGDPDPGPPGLRALLVADGAVALATVVPYVAYLALSESSRHRATVGKRWAGLVVADVTGARPGTSQVWLRNLVKALPWHVAHLGVLRAVLDVQPTLAVTLIGLSLVLAGACAAPALAGGRGLHDRVAGTRVERASPEGSARVDT